MSNNGQSMGLGLSMMQSISPEFEIGLDDDEKRRLSAAVELWDAKQHSVFEFRTVDLLAMFNPPDPNNSDDPEKEGKSVFTWGDVFKRQFMFLNKEEMESIDPDEKIAGTVGGILYISENVPKEYIPFIVLNLSLLSLISDKQALEACSALGLDSVSPYGADQLHWTANMFDIIVAENHFGKDSKEFIEFLEWRKNHERTNFFKNENVDAYINNRLSKREFHRTHHPLKRGKYCKMSWQLAQTCTGNQMLEEFARDSRTSRVDIVLFKIMQESNFNIENMLQAIKQIRNTLSENYDTNQNEVEIDFSSQPELDIQAYLLTADVSGVSGETLIQKTPEGLYLLKIQALSTLNALEDKLIYFANDKFRRNGLQGDNIQWIKRALKGSAIATDIPGLPEINLNNAGDISKIENHIQAVDGQIAQIEQALQNIAAFEEKMNRLVTDSSANIVPAQLGIEREKLFAKMVKLNEKKTAALQHLDLFKELNALRETCSTIIEGIPDMDVENTQKALSAESLN